MVTTIFSTLLTMYLTVFAFLVSADYGFCQKNCSQTSPQVITRTADLPATAAYTSYSMKDSFKQATVEIQLNELHGSAVINLTFMTDSSDVSLTSLHKSFSQHRSSDIDVASMLRQSVYQTGRSSLPTGISISTHGSSVLPTQKANFSGFFSPRLTFLPSQSPTATNIGIFTGSGVPSTVLDIFNLLLFGSLSTAMILIF